MKKFFLLLFVLLNLYSCSKEYSYESNCGIIVGKKTTYFDKVNVLLIKYENITDPIIKAVNEPTYNSYEIGDSYCK